VVPALRAAWPAPAVALSPRGVARAALAVDTRPVPRAQASLHNAGMHSGIRNLQDFPPGHLKFETQVHCESASPRAPTAVADPEGAVASTPRSHDTAPFSVPAPWFFAGAGFALALLLAHAWLYRFLCDDAFISFPYARNLSHGYGLVFNPGLEHVEGYTDFLWVVLLAGMDRLGIRPERAASLLSVAATIGLWAMVLWFAARRGGGGSGARSLSLLALVPCLLLAATRSVAGWGTSGLEAR